ncbi:MAG: hypothetical protein DWQ07_11655 [Chloroflexi bacterium]|nr:MAG: hypothetical protein DWQ07_11655 [Chloroflexota bacterium]MBL1197139.1 hypothetical protein [Chloroflexota bacterium]NOH14434.1 hypothetical protein [Chloroflexota bacterium]
MKSFSAVHANTRYKYLSMLVLLASFLLVACSAIPGLPLSVGQEVQAPTDTPIAAEFDTAATEAAAGNVQATANANLNAQAPLPTAVVTPTVTPTVFIDPAARQVLTFEEGSTVAEVFGAVEAFSVMEYLIPAGQLQRMEVTLRTADEALALSVITEDGLQITGDIEEQFFWRGQLPATTNSVLRIAGSTERVIFSILAETPGRIQLDEGVLFETVQGEVSPEDRDAEFLVQPPEGETLTLKVTAPDNDVLISATGAQDGQLYLGIPAEFGGYQIEVTDPQDYLVAVLGTSGATQFSLDVSIKVVEEEDEVVSADGTPVPVRPVLLAEVDGKAVPRFWQTRNGNYSFNAACGYVDTIPKQEPEGRIKLPDGLRIWIVEDGSFTFGDCLVDISYGIFRGDSGKQWVIIADHPENRENELLRTLIGLPLRRADVIYVPNP